MRKAAIRWIDVLALMACVAFGGGWLAERRGWLDPAPFRNVAVQSITREPGAVVVAATYEKTGADCELILPIVTFGFVLGVRQSLAYEPIRQANQGAQRHPGEQLMTLRILTGDRTIDRVEIRTRHKCSGRRVDSLMLAVDVPEA